MTLLRAFWALYQFFRQCPASYEFFVHCYWVEFFSGELQIRSLFGSVWKELSNYVHVKCTVFLQNGAEVNCKAKHTVRCILISDIVETHTKKGFYALKPVFCIWKPFLYIHLHTYMYSWMCFDIIIDDKNVFSFNYILFICSNILAARLAAVPAHVLNTDHIIKFSSRCFYFF